METDRCCTPLNSHSITEGKKNILSEHSPSVTQLSILLLSTAEFFFRRVNYLQTARRINDWGKKQQTFREPTAFVLSLFVPSSLPLRHIFNFHSNPSLLECADRTVIIFPFVQRLEDIGVVRKLFGQNYKEKPSFPCSNLWPSLVRTHL